MRATAAIFEKPYTPFTVAEASHAGDVIKPVLRMPG